MRASPLLFHFHDAIMANALAFSQGVISWWAASSMPVWRALRPDIWYFSAVSLARFARLSVSVLSRHDAMYADSSMPPPCHDALYPASAMRFVSFFTSLVIERSDDARYTPA